MLITFYHNEQKGFHYAIDDKTNLVYIYNKRGGCQPLSLHYSKHGAKVNLYIFQDGNRLRSRQVYLSTIIGKHVLQLKRKFVINYKDGNKRNINIDNIEYQFIGDMNVKWVPVKDGYPDMYVSDTGLIYREKYAEIIDTPFSRSGYGTVPFPYETRALHRVVWSSFHPNEDIPKGYVIDHIDNNPMNNSLSNLQLISVRENNLKDLPPRLNGLPTGVQRYGTKFHAVISYTLNGVNHSNVFLGYYKNVEDASQNYQKALEMINHGIDPIKHSPYGDVIRYSFATDTWWFSLPLIWGGTVKRSGFKKAGEAYDEYCNLIYEERCNINSFIDRCLKYKHLTFNYLGNAYQIKYHSNTKEEFTKIIKEYLENKRLNNLEKFIHNIPDINQKLLSLSENCHETTKTTEVINTLESRDKTSFVIQQFSLNGELIEEYPSCLSAGKQFDSPYTASKRIGECCRGERKSYYGFMWQRKIRNQ